MKLTLPILAVLLFFASCTTSKIYTAQTCKICLSKSDGILVLPLAWEPSFRLLSVAEKNQLERQILSDLRNKGFTDVELYDQLDYELLKAGIKDLNDPIQRAKINSELGYPYLLGLSLGPAREGEGWSYQRPEEVYAQEAIPEMEVSAILRVALIESETGLIVSDNSIASENSGFSRTDEDGGLDYWNFATLSGVIRSGVGKGIDFMVKDCGC
jgi:hypothetical protein